MDRAVVVDADRPILSAAVANLLQNALTFTRPKSTVKLRLVTNATRVLIEVEDQCGGLPPGAVENLLKPFVQKGRDKSGLGLGLTICTMAAKMLGGELYIRDLPGEGCIFTIDLPRPPPPPTSIYAKRSKTAPGAVGSGGQGLAGVS